MAETRTIQTNFNKGEMSPLIASRVDQQGYFNGLHTCLNWIPLVQGGIRVRGGFKYAGPVKTAAAKTYLVPFTSSATKSYVLEFGNLYIRIWGYDANGEPDQIDVGGTPVEVTTTYATADLPELQYHQSGDILYIVAQDYAPAKLEHISETSWRLTTIAFNPPATYEGKTDLNVTMYSSHATGSGRTLTTGAVSSAAYFYVGDRGRYIATVDGGLAYITAVADGGNTCTVDILEGSFKLVAAPYAAGEWWLMGSPLKPAKAGMPTSLGANVVITAREVDDSVAVNAFRTGSQSVGKYIHMLGGTAKIHTVNDSTNVTGTSLTLFSDGASTPAIAAGGAWTLEQASWGAAAYPTAITIGEQRVWYAGAANEPDTLRSTVIGDYQNFAPGVNDDLSCIYTMSTDETQLVRWIHWWQGLVVGTLKKIIVMKSPTATGLTPTDLPNLSEYAGGCAAIQPFRAGNALLYVENGGKRVFQFEYNYLSDLYKATDLTQFADHLTWTYSFTDNAWAPSPDNLGYYRRSDGTLCALVFNPDEKVIGWSRITTSTAAGQSDIESICTVFNPVKNRYELWAAIKRTINGSTVRYVEVLDPDRRLDCSYTYSGAAASEITGLNHLAAESVMVKSSTAVYPAQTVTGNKVTGLVPNVTAAEVGIVFTATAKQARVEIPGAPTIQGALKTQGPILIRCLSTPVLSIGGVKYKRTSAYDPKGKPAGYSAASVFTIPTTDAIASATESGDLIIPSDGTGWDYDGQITITQNLPLGGTVLMLSAKVTIGD